ncbi:MAG: MaoC family dehydratase [Myxococcota bacterium]
MNLRGEPLAVGDRIHQETREVSPEIVAFYCETFGDFHPLYAKETAGLAGETDFGSPIAPPLLYHSEVYRHIDRWYLKNLVGNLHARQEWLLFAPFRHDEPIVTRSTIVERYSKRGRDYVVNEVDYSDSSGRLCVRGRTHQSFLAERVDAEAGFVVDRSSAAAKPRRPVGEGEGAEIEPREWTVDREMCWRFSGPGRSYHTDEDEARKLGFPAIVVQGMLTTCMVSQIMGDAHGAGWFAGGRMDLKLTNVLWADERVRARGKVRSEVPEGSRVRRELEVWVEKDDPDRTVVSVGRASALL